MTLRRTILLSIALALAALVFVLFYTLESTLLRQYEAEETQTILDAVHRSQALLDVELESLQAVARRWAESDSAYRYIQNTNPAFILSNTDPSTLNDLDIHLMAFLDLQGKTAYLRHLDPATGQSAAIPAGLSTHLAQGSLLLHTAESIDPRQGLLSTPNGALMLVSRPILKTGGSGPAAGTLLIGRYLNFEHLQRLRSLSQLSFNIFPYNSSESPQDVLNIKPTLQDPGAETSRIQDEATATGYLLLGDYDHQPAYILRVDVPRTNYRSRQATITYLSIYLVMSAVVFSVSILILFEGLVLSRLARLNKEVNRIGQTGDLSRRVTVQSRDEIASLSRNINQSLESLEQAQQQRQEADQRFRTLVKSMEDVVLTLDMDEKVTEVFGRSAHTSEILNVVEGRPHNSDDSAHLIHHLAFIQAANGQPQVYEWEGRFQGQPFFIQTSLSPMRNEQGEVIGVVSVGRDITRLKLLEQDLQERISDLSALYQASRIFLSRLDLQNTFSAATELAVDALGSRSAWIGRIIEPVGQVRPVAAQGAALDQIPPIHLAAAPPSQEAFLIQQAVRQRQMCTSLDTPSPQELPALLPDLPPECIFTALPLIIEDQVHSLLFLYRPPGAGFHAQGSQLLQSFANLASFALQNAIFYDQVRSGRARMQELSYQLVEIQENERQRLAQELHDEIGQLLTGLRILIETAANQPQKASQERLRQAVELAEQLIARVRQMSLDLRPAMLDDLGLIPALAWLFERYTSQTSIQVHFQHLNLETRRFPTQVETTTYRIIQEALTNIARHAGVNEAWVRLWAAEDSLGVQVEDAGQGFDPEEALERHLSRGLIGMKERVERLSGTFNILSSPQEGTQISAQLPFNPTPRS